MVVIRVRIKMAKPYESVDHHAMYIYDLMYSTKGNF